LTGVALQWNKMGDDPNSGALGQEVSLADFGKDMTDMGVTGRAGPTFGTPVD